jgi:exonuclease SbcC
MLTKIVLHNYMAHAHTELDLAPGLNVLIGPNNCGKSAVVSALQTVCGDFEGEFMVRHGERDCWVEVQTDDAHIVRWRRRGRAISYTIDGCDVSRAGRANLPDGLMECLRLDKVRAKEGDEEYDVHFGLQKEPIFLIDSEGKTARFFSTTSDAEKLLEMQRRHRERTVNARRRTQELQGEEARVARRLLDLDPLDALGKDMEAAEVERASHEAETEAVGGLGRAIQETQRQAIAQEALRVQLRVLDQLANPPLLADQAPLEAMISEHRRRTLEADVARRLSKSLASLPVAPVLADATDLENLITALRDATATRAREAARTELLAALAAPAKPCETTELAQLVSDLRARERDIQQYTKTEQNLAEQLASVSAVMRRWWQEHPVCPVCGKPTNPDEQVAELHEHTQTEPILS